MNNKETQDDIVRRGESAGLGLAGVLLAGIGTTAAIRSCAVKNTQPPTAAPIHQTWQQTEDERLRGPQAMEQPAKER
jgi:hypothetical protein